MAQVAGFAGIRLDISDFPTRHPYGLGLWQKPHRAPPRRLGRRAERPDPLRHRGDRVRAGRRRRRRRAVRRPTRAGAVPRRLRRGPQPGPQGGRHRVPRLGADDEQPDRRGRDDRGAGAGRPPHALGHPRPGQDRVRGHGRRGGLPARRDGRGDADRVGRSAPASRPCDDLREALIAVYGTDYGMHERHLDHPVHRHDPAGRGLPQGTGPAGRRRRPRAFPDRRSGPQHGRAGRGEPGLEAGPGGQGDLAGHPPRHLPRRAAPGRRPRAAHHHGAGRADARGRSNRGVARQRGRAAGHGRAAHDASPR